MSTASKRYAITAESTENYHAVLARLRGLGTSVVTASLGKKRIVADIKLESTVHSLRDMGATVEPQRE